MSGLPLPFQTLELPLSDQLLLPPVTSPSGATPLHLETWDTLLPPPAECLYTLPRTGPKGARKKATTAPTVADAPGFRLTRPKRKGKTQTESVV